MRTVRCQARRGLLVSRSLHPSAEHLGCLRRIIAVRAFKPTAFLLPVVFHVVLESRLLLIPGSAFCLSSATKIRVFFKSACQRKVEVSSFSRSRSVRLQGFLHGCSGGTWYLGLNSLGGWAFCFVSPGGRRPEGLTKTGVGSGQCCKRRYRFRKRSQCEPSNRRSISTAAPRSPAHTSSRDTPQRTPSQLTVWSGATFRAARTLRISSSRCSRSSRRCALRGFRGCTVKRCSHSGRKRIS